MNLKRFAGRTTSRAAGVAGTERPGEMHGMAACPVSLRCPFPHFGKAQGRDLCGTVGK